MKRKIMDNQVKATQVFDMQIAEVQEKIDSVKINIADVVIKTSNIDIKTIKSPKDLLPFVDDIDKMPEYMRSVKEHEKVLAALIKSRAEIESVYTGLIAK